MNRWRKTDDAFPISSFCDTQLKKQNQMTIDSAERLSPFCDHGIERIWRIYYRGICTRTRATHNNSVNLISINNVICLCNILRVYDHAVQTVTRIRIGGSPIMPTSARERDKLQCKQIMDKYTCQVKAVLIIFS